MASLKQFWILQIALFQALVKRTSERRVKRRTEPDIGPKSPPDQTRGLRNILGSRHWCVAGLNELWDLGIPFWPFQPWDLWSVETTKKNPSLIYIRTFLLVSFLSRPTPNLKDHPLPPPSGKVVLYPVDTSLSESESITTLHKSSKTSRLFLNPDNAKNLQNVKKTGIIWRNWRENWFELSEGHQNH